MKRPCIHRPIKHPSHSEKSGQALLESFGIIMLLCMILFGMVQYVLMLTATEVVQYSADAAVRARAVGFNRFMVQKVTNVASIPNAGLMTHPERMTMGAGYYRGDFNTGVGFYRAVSENPGSAQYAEIERPTIPLYLGSESWGRARGLLDYRDWETVHAPLYSRQEGLLRVTVIQNYPLRIPMWSAFSRRDEIRIQREARLADHAEHYLQ